MTGKFQLPISRPIGNLYNLEHKLDYQVPLSSFNAINIKGGTDSRDDKTFDNAGRENKEIERENEMKDIFYGCFCCSVTAR